MCDVCKRETTTERVTITMRGKARVVDVCSSCAEPVAAVADCGSTGPRKRAKVDKPEAHRIIPIA